MNTELFIARRLVFDKESNKSISRSIVKIAVFGISMGLIVMILSVAIVTGFKNEISEKVIGFGSHIQIMNYDSNTSYETEPISKFQSFYPGLDSLPGIKHAQVFATKAGILKTRDQIQGVILKGVDKDFHWDFFENNLLEGEVFKINDSVTSNEIIISKYIADLLKLNAGDHIATYFVQDPPRMRRFVISGIYETSLTEFDQIFVLADIRHIQKLNNWGEDQVSGLEITIKDFDELEKMTRMVRNIAGYTFTKEGTRLKVTNIRNKYPQIFDWLNLQNINVWVILILMLLVAGFNMVSGLLVLILERTNMIGILKSLGTENTSVRKIFLYQSAFLITRGLLWGNLIGLGLALLQKEFSIIKLDQASYYLETVPINLSLAHVLLLNAGTLIATIFMLILPTVIISRISPEKTIRYN